jgi:hypothetical protein
MRTDTLRRAIAVVVVFTAGCSPGWHTPGSALAIDPASVSMIAGATRQFVATDGVQAVGAVDWSVDEGVMGGIVDGSGNFVPAASGTFHVRATSQAAPATTAVATVVVSPAATVSATAPVMVFADALSTGWFDWSWASHSLANTSPVSGGTHSILVNYSAWSGLSFETPSPLAGLAYLEFDANGGATSNPVLHAQVQQTTTGGWGPQVTVGQYCAGGAIPSNAFTHCKIPLSAMGATASVQRFAIEEGAGKALPSMYLDQVVLTPDASPAIQAFSAAPATVTAGANATLSATFSF